MLYWSHDDEADWLITDKNEAATESEWRCLSSLRAGAHPLLARHPESAARCLHVRLLWPRPVARKQAARYVPARAAAARMIQATVKRDACRAPVSPIASRGCGKLR